MLIGICQIELFVPDSGSLKSKRFILNSVKTRIRNKFNVSIAEVGETNKWQRVTLGISMVANEKKFIDRTLAQIINFIDNDGRVELLDHHTDII